MPKNERARCPYEATCPFALAMNAQDALTKGLKGLLPEEFRQHMIGAEREFLLALRSLVDGLLQAMGPKEERRRARRIKVE